MELPSRDPSAEDAFVAGLTDASEEVVQEAVELALEAQRPKLAARLVLLLDRPELTGAAEKAMRAARWLLLENAVPDDAPAPLVYWRRWQRRPLSRYRRTVMASDQGFSPRRR